MTVIESILKDLQGLPTPRLVDVARYVHSLNEDLQEERLALLRRTHGVLNEEDGNAFQTALSDARRVES